MKLPTANLSKVARPVLRPIPVTPGTLYRTIGVKWWGEGAYERQTIDGTQTAAKTLSIVHEGDLIINKIWVRHGSTAIASQSVNGCAASGEFPTFELDRKQVLPSWMHWLTKSRNFWQECDNLSRGTSGKNRIRPELFLTIQIPLPPIEEQQRIVARIEELAAKIEEARGLRREAMEETETFIDSVLRKILEINANNSDWKHDRIPEFIEVNPSRKGKTDFSQLMPVSFVPMAAVDDKTGQILAPEIKPFMEVSKGYTMFVENDVIFARITPCMQNGKAALAKNLVNGVGFGSTEFYVLRPGPKVLGEWLHRLVRYKDFRDDAETHMKGTAGQQRVQQSFFTQKQIPVPPLEEQQSIVTYLDNLQAKVETMKRVQAETSAELDALLPSILDKAFKGEL